MNQQIVADKLKRMADAAGEAKRRHDLYERLHRDADIADVAGTATPEATPPALGGNNRAENA